MFYLFCLDEPHLAAAVGGAVNTQTYELPLVSIAAGFLVEEG